MTLLQTFVTREVGGAPNVGGARALGIVQNTIFTSDLASCTQTILCQHQEAPTMVNITYLQEEVKCLSGETEPCWYLTVLQKTLAQSPKVISLATDLRRLAIFRSVVHNQTPFFHSSSSPSQHPVHAHYHAHHYVTSGLEICTCSRAGLKESIFFASGQVLD